MRVILLQDIARIGRRFEIKDVPDGHALNMLIPKGMAETATKENIKRIQARAEKLEAERAESDALFAKVIEKSKDSAVTVEVEANEQGHMFQALKADVVVAALEKEGMKIDEAQIIMNKAIKEVGEHSIELQAGELKGTVKITVVAKK